MKIAIIGFGLEGQAAYDYWKQGNDLTICDQNPEIVVPEGVATQIGDSYLQNLDLFDFIIRSPFVHPKKIVEANGPDILQKVTSCTNEFLKVCPTRNIIGVTGTKGKGTTSTLVTKMLEAAGKTVYLGGNIGLPALELLKNNITAQDWVVLELSNFQLIDLKSSPAIAACLLVEGEHLDWHRDLDEYLAAKQQLFRWQTPENTAIFYDKNDNSKKIVSVSQGKKIPYYAEPGALVESGVIKIDGQHICKTNEVRLLGQHNWQNICAAATVVWQVEQNTKAIGTVATTFAGLPFRLELRAEKNGIRYYNDSFASQPEATCAAIEAVPGKKVLIVGGYDRRLSLEHLARTLKKQEESIQKVVLVGNAALRATEVFEANGFFNYIHESSREMLAIVHRAREFAHAGDAIVLSPGFASFDMFKNFEERGKAFNEAVDAL